MGSKAPAPADYTGAAQATGQASQEAQNTATWANRPTINTPWGQQSWQAQSTIDPTTGKPVTTWQQNINLTPDQQAALDAQMRVKGGLSGIAEGKIGQVAGALGQSPDYSNLTPWGMVPQGGQGIQFNSGMTPGQGMQYGVQGAGQGIQSGVQGAGQGIQRAFDFGGAAQRYDPMAANQQGFNASMNQMASRLDPQWNQQEDAVRSRLYNQGLKEGDPAFDQAMGNFGRNRNDAYTSAMNQSVLTGGQLGNQLFQQSLAGRGQDLGAAEAQGQFGNQAQQQAWNQMFQNAGFGNQAQQQAFQQLLQNAGFGNQAQGQTWQQAQQAMQGNNQAQAQQFGQGLQTQAAMDAQRNNQFNQTNAMRGQNLNELQALLSGQQVGMPMGFASAPGTTQGAAQGANYLGAAQMQDQANLASWNANQQAMQGWINGIGSIAGAGASMFGF